MDLTYIPTAEGWLYLAAVKDMATCEIIGSFSAIASNHLPRNGSMSDRLKCTLCEDALMMGIQARHPPKGLIAHSDRPSRSLPANCCQATDVQYACQSYRRILSRYGIVQSMSRRGNYIDNAPMESFFGSLKTELVHNSHFQTRSKAKAALFDYIEICYNRQRLHSSIGYRTPIEARTDMTTAMAA